MENESPKVDLRESSLPFVNVFVENGGKVYQVVFEGLSLLLNERQMDMLKTS